MMTQVMPGAAATTTAPPMNKVMAMSNRRRGPQRSAREPAIKTTSSDAAEGMNDRALAVSVEKANSSCIPVTTY